MLTICHVIVVVIDTLEADTVFKCAIYRTTDYIYIVYFTDHTNSESLKPSCISDSKVVNPDKSELEEYYPQIGTYITYVSTHTYNELYYYIHEEMIRYT